MTAETRVRVDEIRDEQLDRAEDLLKGFCFTTTDRRAEAGEAGGEVIVVGRIADFRADDCP
jgi:hypothetical protein